MAIVQALSKAMELSMVQGFLIKLNEVVRMYYFLVAESSMVMESQVLSMVFTKVVSKVESRSGFKVESQVDNINQARHIMVVYRDTLVTNKLVKFMSMVNSQEVIVLDKPITKDSQVTKFIAGKIIAMASLFSTHQSFIPQFLIQLIHEHICINLLAYKIPLHSQYTKKSYTNYQYVLIQKDDVQSYNQASNMAIPTLWYYTFQSSPNLVLILIPMDHEHNYNLLSNNHLANYQDTLKSYKIFQHSYLNLVQKFLYVFQYLTFIIFFK